MASTLLDTGVDTCLVINDLAKFRDSLKILEM